MRGLGPFVYQRRAGLLGIPYREGLTPLEREAEIPGWCIAELYASEAAERRLEVWARSTPQPWKTPEPFDILQRLHFYEDPPLAEVTSTYLSALPPPVVDHVLNQTTWIGVGLSVTGTCGARPDFGDRPFVITVSAGADADRFRELVYHETAHAWLLPTPAPTQRGCLAFNQGVLIDTPWEQVPTESRDCVAQLREKYARDEREAERLVKRWLEVATR